MAYVTLDDRVDRLEALFGQFMTELAMLNRQAKERDRRRRNAIGPPRTGWPALNRK